MKEDEKGMKNINIHIVKYKPNANNGRCDSKIAVSDVKLLIATVSDVKLDSSK